MFSVLAQINMVLIRNGKTYLETNDRLYSIYSLNENGKTPKLCLYAFSTLLLSNNLIRATADLLLLVSAVVGDLATSRKTNPHHGKKRPSWKSCFSEARHSN